MSKKKKIAIVDYGVGNLRSLIMAFEHFEANVLLTEDADEIMASDAIVLPGDGAYAAGMSGIAVRNIKEAIIKSSKSGKPTFGICLGAQILLSDGYEFGHHKGLNLIPGKVVRFPKLKEREKVPQIGWNEVYPVGPSKSGILRGIDDGADVYFVHSYIIVPEKQVNVLAYTNYGGIKFCSVVGSGNTIGVQFHPEKSGQVGLAIVKNFINMINA